MRQQLATLEEVVPHHLAEQQAGPVLDGQGHRITRGDLVEEGRELAQVLGRPPAGELLGQGPQLERREPGGIDVDATGLSPQELRDLSKELSGRRPAKDLRQLSAFLDEMAPGDLVGLPIEHGAGLLLGVVVGDYLFQGRELLPHRRPARWDRVVPRSAARPPATLQDPRALFSVVLDPDVLPASLAGTTYREPALPLV